MRAVKRARSGVAVSCEVLEARQLMSGTVEAETPDVAASPAVMSPAVSAVMSSLVLGEWTWTLPTVDAGTASLTARVYNFDASGYSGSIGLSLWLSSQPFGQGGYYYTISQDVALPQLTAGTYMQYSTAAFFSLSSVPAGSYYIVAAVSEFDGLGYTVVSGDTASRMYTITQAAPEPPPVVPAELPPDVTAPGAFLKGKAVVTGGKAYKFTITYLDAGGLDVNSIDTADVSVTDPFGATSSPLMVKVKRNRPGTKCTVTYSLPAPSGKWYSDDNGTYTIDLADGEVWDVAGNAVGGGYWTFAVQARKPNPFSLVAQIRPRGLELGHDLASVSDEVLGDVKDALAA